MGLWIDYLGVGDGLPDEVEPVVVDFLEDRRLSPRSSLGYSWTLQLTRKPLPAWDTEVFIINCSS